MAVKIAAVTGNFLTAGTWKDGDATAYLNSESGSTTVPSSAGTGARSAAFTPGAITIDGIGVKLANRTGTTGTITVELYNNTLGAVVAATTVTANTADLPAGVTADLNGGWQLFTFAATLLLVATDYMVQVTTSSSTQVVLFTNGTANNWSRFLRTTTTGAPAAGDDMIICEEKTGAGAATAVTVTMNETAATDYGAASTSLVTPAMAVCDGGTLIYNAASAGNPLLQLSGNFIVYAGGVFNQGTTGTPIPRDSVAHLQFDCAADGDFGLTVRNLGTWNSQGLSRTSGKDFVQTLLNTDEAVNSTSLGVADDTGWLDNDGICVASTSRTPGECEAGALNGNAGASSLTVDGFAGAGGGLAFAHSGTSPTQATVGLLTQNVRVHGVTSTLMSYVNVKATSTVDIDWTEFYYLGQDVTGQRGIVIETTTGAFDMRWCSLHDMEDGGIQVVGSTTNNYSIRDVVMYRCNTTAATGFAIPATSGTTWTVSRVSQIRCGIGGTPFSIADLGGTLTDFLSCGAGNTGGSILDAGAIAGTISGITVHASTGAPPLSIGSNNASARTTGTISNIKVWRNASTGAQIAAAFTGRPGPSGLTVDGLTAFGNLGTNIGTPSDAYCGWVTIKNLVLAGDSTFSTTNGILIQATSTGNFKLISPSFSQVTGIFTAMTNDISLNSTTFPVQIYVQNGLMGGTNALVSYTSMTEDGFVEFQRFNQTAVDHRYYKGTGILQTDSVIFNSAAPSMRATPNSATIKLDSANYGRGIKVPVNSAATCSIAVYVRKSAIGDGAAYNGNEPRLIQKANPALGQNSDVVLDTMTVAVGNWEQLVGTSSTATDNGAFEFVVDCDGTAGFISVDDWSTS